MWLSKTYGSAFCASLQLEHKSVIESPIGKLLAAILWMLKKSQNKEHRPETTSISQESQL